MQILLRDNNSDYLLELPIRVWAWAFFILPLLRLIIFRVTGIAIPLSTQIAAITILSLLILLPSRLTFNFPKEILSGILLLFVALITYLINGISSTTPSGVLATIWIYFAAPFGAILIGTLSYNHADYLTTDLASKTVDRYIYISILCLLTGIAINIIDFAILRDSYFQVYKEYGTTAAASFAGFSLPRLAGAYFSGLDLTFAIVLLFIIQTNRDRNFSRSTFLILNAAILLTFTRNSYVILIMWNIISRLSIKNVSRFAALGYLLSPILSLGVMGYLGLQSASGQLEPNEETSSILTRLSSWMTIFDRILNDPTKILYGLGLTQNALIPGESEIYAIDNFFWELICYAGLIAFIAYGFLFRIIRKQALNKDSSISRISLALLAITPISGIFNNMAGSMFSFIIFVTFGIIAKLERGNNEDASNLNTSFISNTKN